MSRRTVAALVAAAGLAVAACGSGGTVRVRVTTTATVTASATVTATPTIQRVVATRTRVRTVTYTPPPPTQYGEGTYVVGTDIQPGVYHTAGSPDCYWARLSGLDPMNDIITNSVSSGPQTVQVMASDKAFMVQGSCSFGRVGG